jgi:hypothetical protein
MFRIMNGRGRGALRGAEGCGRSKTMMDATGRWLAPMMAAADEHGIDVQALMTQATTVTMLSRPRAWGRPPPAGDEQRQSLDWLRFGQLLREALGWDEYPERPPE